MATILIDWVARSVLNELFLAVEIGKYRFHSLYVQYRCNILILRRSANRTPLGMAQVGAHSPIFAGLVANLVDYVGLFGNLVCTVNFKRTKPSLLCVDKQREIKIPGYRGLVALPIAACTQQAKTK